MTYQLEELKPCPFCGFNRQVIHIDVYHKVYIACGNCDVKIEYDCLNSDPTTLNYLEGLVTDWNKRRKEFGEEEE